MISLVRRWFYHGEAIRGWDEICEHFESQSCEVSETMKLDDGNVIEPDAIDSATGTSMTVSPLAPEFHTDPALPDCDIKADDDDDKYTIIRYKCLTFKIEGKFSIEILKYFTSLIKYEVRLTISIPLV